MGLMDIFRRNRYARNETRASGGGFTAEIMAARESWIAGRSGLGELTATVQSCVSLWEHALSAASVSGTDLLDRRTMALCGRTLALRGEAVFLIGERGLIPASDWDVSTRDGEPRAYRLSVSEAGGGRTVTALAAEVLHLRIGSDPVAPWTGTAPLRRAQLTAGLLHAVESALAEAYENMPLGTSVLPFPETPSTDMEALGRGFRGKRGRVLLRESVQVQAAGGPAPAQDWRQADMTPDLQRAMTAQTLQAARDAICGVYGVLPSWFSPTVTGPQTREAQRQLATWTLQPIAMQIAEEATAKLGGAVEIDTLQPLQAFDAGGRARAVTAVIGALAQAKEAGIDPDAAMKLVGWADDKGDN